jgi:hypothetical protein
MPPRREGGLQIWPTPSTQLQRTNVGFCRANFKFLPMASNWPPLAEGPEVRYISQTQIQDSILSSCSLQWFSDRQHISSPTRYSLFLSRRVTASP